MTREKQPRSRALWVFYAISVSLHAALGIGAVVAPEKQKPSEAVAIALQEIQEAQKAEAPPPPPPPPRPPPPKPQEKPREEPKPEPEPEAQADAGDADPSQFEDLGMVAGNSGGPGVAVAMNRPREKAEARPEPVRRKVATLGPRPGDCSDPPVKPRFLNRVMPEYTEAARQADVEGDVVLEVLLDENGKVLSVRVVKALGHGLDEKAIEAARASTYTPATQCGKPIKFPVPIKFRFELGS